MLRGIGKKIIMTEGDFGLDLPIKINGATFETNDKIKMLIKHQKNGLALIEKEFQNIQNNTINFFLTKEESSILKPVDYVYILDWYRNNDFLCNIVPDGTFQVEDKY